MPTFQHHRPRLGGDPSSVTSWELGQTHIVDLEVRLQSTIVTIGVDSSHSCSTDSAVKKLKRFTNKILRKMASLLPPLSAVEAQPLWSTHSRRIAA